MNSSALGERVLPEEREVASDRSASRSARGLGGRGKGGTLAWPDGRVQD